MTAKIKKCAKCRVKLPDISRSDSFHLQCEEKDKWQELLFDLKYRGYIIDPIDKD